MVFFGAEGTEERYRRPVAPDHVPAGSRVGVRGPTRVTAAPFFPFSACRDLSALVPLAFR